MTTAMRPASTESSFWIPFWAASDAGFCDGRLMVPDVECTPPAVDLPAETVLATVSSGVVAGVAVRVDTSLLNVADVEVATAPALAPALTDNPENPSKDSVKPGVRGCVSRIDKSDC